MSTCVFSLVEHSESWCSGAPEKRTWPRVNIQLIERWQKTILKKICKNLEMVRCTVSPIRRNGLPDEQQQLRNAVVR